MSPSDASCRSFTSDRASLTPSWVFIVDEQRTAKTLGSAICSCTNHLQLMRSTATLTFAIATVSTIATIRHAGSLPVVAAVNFGLFS